MQYSISLLLSLAILPDKHHPCRSTNILSLEPRILCFFFFYFFLYIFYFTHSKQEPEFEYSAKRHKPNNQSIHLGYFHTIFLICKSYISTASPTDKRWFSEPHLAPLGPLYQSHPFQELESQQVFQYGNAQVVFTRPNAMSHTLAHGPP